MPPNFKKVTEEILAEVNRRLDLVAIGMTPLNGPVVTTLIEVLVEKLLPAALEATAQSSGPR